MNAILFVLFFVVILLAFSEELMTVRIKCCILAGLCLIMIILPATKDINVVTDAASYEDLFDNNDNPLIELITEPTYIYISRLIIVCGGTFAMIFLVYALITVPIKLTMLNKLTPFVFSAMLIYIPVYYELHELVQIRAGAAGAFLLCSVYFYANKRYIPCILVLIIAVSFHYSSMIFIPLYCLGNRDLSVVSRWMFASIVPIGFLMYFLRLDLFMLIPSSVIGGKVDGYTNSNETLWGEVLLPYKNPFFMLKCCLFLVILWCYDNVKHECKYLSIILKAEAGSLFMMFSLSTVPIIQGRLSELYGIIDPILFSYIIYLVKPRYAARTILVCIGLFMLIYNFLLAHYFDAG